MCNHRDHAGVGVALPDRLHEFRIEKLKELGCNAFRASHYPHAPELLDACDRLGILVMAENRLAGSSPEMLVATARHDPPRPQSPQRLSLVAGQRRAHGAVEHRRRAHRRDDGSALSHARPDPQSHHRDARQGTGRRLRQHRRRPRLELHQSRRHRRLSSQASRIARSSAAKKPAPSARAAFTPTTQSAATSAPTTSARPSGARPRRIGRSSSAQRPWLAGAFVWTGFDYRGEPIPYKWPCTASHFGLMDLCGFPKDNYFYYKSWWSDQTVLHLFPHWNWAGREGEAIDVRCFTNCDEVELFLNHDSHGRKSVERNSTSRGACHYEPGTLEAIGYRGRKSHRQNQNRNHRRTNANRPGARSSHDPRRW